MKPEDKELMIEISTCLSSLGSLGVAAEYAERFGQSSKEIQEWYDRDAIPLRAAIYEAISHLSPEVQGLPEFEDWKDPDRWGNHRDLERSIRRLLLPATDIERLISLHDLLKQAAELHDSTDPSAEVSLRGIHDRVAEIWEQLDQERRESLSGVKGWLKNPSKEWVQHTMNLDFYNFGIF